jgi:gas vesicle protein
MEGDIMRNEYEREETSAATKLTYLLVGGGIGAILALLFAPKSGEELREDIADATRKGIEKSKVAASQIQEKAGEYYEVSKEKAEELYHTAADKAVELSEKAKSVAASTANPFTAAIDAGKDAYTAEKRKNEAKAISEGRASYPISDENKILEDNDNN